ncbi:MAG: protein kinase [Gemmatimonadota bacterium]|nr:protein kinase [Gemmatimonadota bacterium]
MTNPVDRLTTALAGRYTVERELGAGGMATVYLAEDVKHHRKVALKVLRPELAAILGAERFLKEIEVTANLQHPNILPLYDSGRAAGPAGEAGSEFLYYVMPYVEGETLRDKMTREKQLGVDETIAIAKDVADALHFAHQRSVVHRDIKPENILLQQGKPLVADFGIALAVSHAGGTRLTETGLSLGTPHYMSPEQATGDRELDARSDVYSLGAMVYEMLSGEPPHHGNTVQAIIARILSEDPPPVSRQRPAVPAHVDAAVRKALDKTPADRFPTAAKFAEALGNPAFTLSHTAATPAAPAGPRARQPAIAIALAAVAVLAIGAAVAGWLRTTPKQVFRVSMAIHEDAALTEQSTLRIAMSPDGRRIVYVGPAASSPLNRQLWLRELDALSARPVLGTEGAMSPFFSRDGSAIGFFTGEPGDLRVVPTDGGPVRTIVTGGADPWGGDWGPDGRIYFTGPDGHLLRISPGGTTIDTVATPDRTKGELEYDFAHVLPNGKGAIVEIWHSSVDDATIAVVALATGAVTTLAQGVNARYLPTGHLVWVTSDGMLLAAPFDIDGMTFTGSSVLIEQGIAVDPDAGAGQFAVSETGNLIYEAGSATGVAQLHWVTRQGEATPVDPDWWGAFGYVALSPDGRSLALTLSGTDGTHVWVKNLEGGGLLRLALGAGTFDRPTWTPDGTSVTYRGGSASERGIWTRRADASQPAERTAALPEGFYADEAVWSPDGTTLVIRGQRPGTMRDILVLRPGTDTVPRELIATAQEEYSPIVSPNGRWIAYTSNESGQEEVYVRPFENPGRARWAVSVGGGTEPLWARNGRELFYRQTAGDLVRRTVTDTPSFGLGPVEKLFDARGFRADHYHRAYDITPRGDRFIMVRRQGLVSELVLVANWFEELNAKVPR